MTYLQLELFEKTEIEKVRDEIKSTHTRVENVRKGIFKKHSLLAQDISLLQDEIYLLKQQIEIIQKYIAMSDIDNNLAYACG